MKNASSGLISLLASSRDFIMCDLWTFTLRNGLILRYTTWDQNLTVSGNTFKAKDVLLEGGKVKQASGLEANETELTCSPDQGGAPSMVGNIPFLQAARAGLFDRATAERSRLFMPTVGDTSLGSVRIFLGEVTSLTVTRNTCILKCQDATYLLNIYMPRRQYQPTCSWTFGDTNCTFNAGPLSVSSSAGAGSLPNQILCGLAQAAGYFNYGVVKGTSGLNAGVSRSVKNYTPGVVQLTGPFPQPFMVGDTFTITPGCSKQYSGTTSTFNASVTNGSTPLAIFTNIGNAAGQFNGYLMNFQSGILTSQVQTIRQWLQNYATLEQPFTSTPNPGDSLVIVSQDNVPLIYGQVISPLTSQLIPLNIDNANGYFNGGTLQFTSGANVGQVQAINSWENGFALVENAFGSTPLIGDECVLTSVSTNNQSTCTGYNNVANFSGMPYVPIPETSW